MTYSEIQDMYISDPDGEWRGSLTGTEREAVTEMETGRLGMLLSELNRIINTDGRRNGQ